MGSCSTAESLLAGERGIQGGGLETNQYAPLQAAQQPDTDVLHITVLNQTFLNTTNIVEMKLCCTAYQALQQTQAYFTPKK